MIKSFVGLLICGLLSTFSYAQIGQGGVPLSLKSGYNISGAPERVVLNSEQFQSILDQGEIDGSASGESYQVGWCVPANLDITKNGSWTYLDNGTKIWRLEIEVPGAKASSVYYDKFYLPKGVSLYLTNENKRQILGAFTADNNTSDGTFSNQALQGSTAYLELNIESYVNIEDIKLGIYFIGAYNRGVDGDVREFSEPLADIFQDPPFGISATCHKNALCPNGDPATKSRTAVARIIIANGPNAPLGYCSGSLINNTGNVAGGSCKPLFLTASHCDDLNGHTDAHFQYWQFRLNYQRSACTGGVNPTPAVSPTMTSGAKFRSRSNYPTFASAPGSTSSRLVQDFLLLELNDAVPSDYYLAGWNKNSNIATPAMSDYYTAFYGFHHPGGDVKKMSYTTAVTASGTFNQTTVPATHWSAPFSFGGTAGGSSGSGLFDVDGYLIGDLSGGPDATCVNDGKDFGTNALYSKLSYGWTNDYDQTAFPTYAGAQSRLKDFLDPLNTGLSKLGPAKASTCEEMPRVTGIRNNQLDKNAISIYPSPSVDGKITLQFNLTSTEDVTLKMYNLVGAEVNSYFIPKIQSDKKVLYIADNLPNGIYIMNVQTSIGQSNFKIVLNR
ncbi:hypothetical protein DBR32_11015 [Taibaiella sp. KBW10]|uniref:T9SS type A sorting domain-containing protein n=1 Tax=Taibaiella sp. KBW10 TaxID=2153357 RepID=UPI000F596F08|nr:T9SS type A sorting domain-containing protein [Taibaiella sp. KBW10]RQO30109.1 hypothetical protein DBR32_11015 [Taibaiella sp. KBW10]